MSKHMSKIAGFSILILMLASMAVAQNSGMMLFATGKVNVNGIGVNRSTTLMDGDVVETASDGTVTMAGNGASVLVQGNSILQYSKQGLNLASGSISVKSAEGVVSHIGTISMQPINGAARYRLSQSGSNIQMDVMEGNVSVSDGTKTVNVTAGRTVTMPCSNCSTMVSQIMQARDMNKSKFQTQQMANNSVNAPVKSNAVSINPGTATTTTAGAPSSGGAAAGGSAGAGGGGMSGTTQAAIIGAGAATAGGIAAAVVLSNRCTSAPCP